VKEPTAGTAHVPVAGPMEQKSLLLFKKVVPVALRVGGLVWHNEQVVVPDGFPWAVSYLAGKLELALPLWTTPKMLVIARAPTNRSVLTFFFIQLSFFFFLIVFLSSKLLNLPEQPISFPLLGLTARGLFWNRNSRSRNETAID
jgi:hypothetical protein